MKIGQVYYSNQKNSEWKVWHEVVAINGNIVTLSHYGKDTDEYTSNFTKKEIGYSVRKGLLIPA